MEALAASNGDEHMAMVRLCEMPATQQRSDALRTLVKWIEANCEVGDHLPTPKFLMGESWVEEFERRGGTCRLSFLPGGERDMGRVSIETDLPSHADPADHAALIDLRRRVGQDVDLATYVIICILGRRSFDELHG